MTSFAPSAASWRAITRPSPRVPPVMTTIFSEKLIRRAFRAAIRAAAYPPSTTAASLIAFMSASLPHVRCLRLRVAFQREAEKRIRLHAQVLAVVEPFLPVELIRDEV